MFKFLATVMLCFTLAVTACSSSNYNSDEVPDISPENLYNVAKSGMATGDFALARRYLEAIDSRYPFGSLTSQVQLDLIYVYYKERESDLALAQINRFIRLSPTHPNIDYVYYMKGLTEIQKRSDMIQDYLGLDRSEKDPSFYQAAFNTFRDLIRSYPNSIYAADARQRMIYIKEELAKRELAIAEYYFEREAYVSSIRHCQNLLYTYRNTQQLRPALELMARGYERLGLVDPANNTRRVLATTFGGSYTPLVSTNSSTPIDPDTGLPVAPAAVSAGEDKSWFDSIGDWIWGEDEAVAAPVAAPVAASAAPVDTVPHTAAPAANAGVPATAAASEDKSWIDSIGDWIWGDSEEEAVIHTSGAASGPDSMRTQTAAATAVASATAAANAPASSSTATAGASGAAAESESGSWIDSLGDMIWGGDESASSASSAVAASGPESARNRAAAQAAMDSAEAAANAPASASGTAAEGQSGSWVDNMSGWMEDVEAPATNASGPESARNRAAAEAVLNSDNAPAAADTAAESAAEGENGPWRGWMNDHEGVPTASGPESARNEAAARAAISGESSAPAAETVSSEPQNIHFN